MGSCSNSSVLLCDNGFVLKQLCSAPEGGHRTPEMQTEQAEKSRRRLSAASDWILLVLGGNGFVLQWVRVRTL